MLALPREDLLTCLRALGDPLRLRIVVLLAHPPGPRSGPFGEDEPGMCVSDLRKRIGRAHALVSHHIQVLRRAGLIRRTRRGRWSLLQLETARVVALGQHVFALGGDGPVPALRTMEVCPPGPLGSAAASSLVSAAPGPHNGAIAAGASGTPSW
ncbi:MAG TPA: metalloregulator ArsR/SmtB family transcription factor [Myxococcaceae bacterium]|nr:metalloregulator ArsR/SmtB family transcription factor [Myxococcaceae bacterium]